MLMMMCRDRRLCVGVLMFVSAILSWSTSVCVLAFVSVFVVVVVMCISSTYGCLCGMLHVLVSAHVHVHDHVW